MLGIEEEEPSGCESGWTMYLEQSFGEPSSISAKKAKLLVRKGGFVEEKSGGFVEETGEEEEEDLSMVSDASSGPPHFYEDDEYYDENVCFCSACLTTMAKKSNNKRRIQTEEPHHPSFLDDTASSHVFSFPKSSFTLTNKQAAVEDVLDFSIGSSATHFKGKSALQNYYSHLKKSPHGKPTLAKPVCREERRNSI
ncbi:uncharacterized protein LOC143851390 isoform X1 [Tasmannia lanceolata]|uniref:uncharacterized protein LOC143851390 isoform X1 n=1 Tax=Tasmannia lanceolata TaxID=3420 RepID=UPI00406394C6